MTSILLEFERKVTFFTVFLLETFLVVLFVQIAGRHNTYWLGKALLFLSWLTLRQVVYLNTRDM